MSRTSDTYKNIFKGVDENLKEIQDKVDCLQRSQVSIHNYITKVENNISELKNLILHRHECSEAYHVRRDEHSESYVVKAESVLSLKNESRTHPTRKTGLTMEYYNNDKHILYQDSGQDQDQNYNRNPKL